MYTRKPTPERIQRMWPNNSLIRKLIWINFLSRNQEVLFMTMEKWPLSWFRDDQGCHPHQRARKQGPGGRVVAKKRQGNQWDFSTYCLVLHQIADSSPQSPAPYYLSIPGTAPVVPGAAPAFVPKPWSSQAANSVPIVYRPGGWGIAAFTSFQRIRTSNRLIGSGLQPKRGIRPKQRTTAGNSHWAIRFLWLPECALKVEHWAKKNYSWALNFNVCFYMAVFTCDVSLFYFFLIYPSWKVNVYSMPVLGLYFEAHNLFSFKDLQLKQNLLWINCTLSLTYI